MKRLFSLVACLMAVMMFSSCGQKKVIHERLLPIKGACNVRDLGGYKAADGKTVRWGLILRSSDLCKLTDEDTAYLSQLPLRTIVDFRDTVEVIKAPDRVPLSVKSVCPLPIYLGKFVEPGTISADSCYKIMIAANRSYVVENQSQYKELFRLLMDNSNTPLLFHCSAGKDRTGFAAAMILFSLGVDRKTVMEDYMLSAEYIKEKYADMLAKYPDMAPMLTVKSEYLQTALDLIDSEYGGPENYLVNVLGVDLVKMRALYTE